MELVARAREAAQTQALESMMGLQVRKSHLDPLPLVARPLELRRSDERAGDVAGLFVDVARHPAPGPVGTAFRL